MKIINQYKGLRKENYILFIGRIVTNMGAMIYPVLTLILNQKMGMDATGVAFVTVLSGIVVLPSGIIGGMLADRYNKKNIIILCDLVSIAMFIICGCIPLTKITIGLLLVASGFQNMEDPVYTALIADITETKNREKASSLMYLGGNIGLIASPTIAGILFKRFLWLNFILSGVALAFSTVLIFFKVRDISPVEEQTKEAAYQEERQDSGLWSILNENRLILIYAISSGVFWAIYAQYGYLMPLDLGRIHGEDGAVIFGSVASINCIEVVLLTPLLTKLLAKITTTGKNFLGQVLVLGGYVIFLITLGHIPFYYVAITCFTLGEILATISAGPFVANRIPSSHRGRINGFITFLHNLFYGVVMFVLGVLYDNFGNVTAWLFAFSLLGIAIIASIALIFWDKKAFPNLYGAKSDSTDFMNENKACLSE